MKKPFSIFWLAILAVGFLPRRGLAQATGLDAYGGALAKSCPNSTGHFIIWKDTITNRWWFCTPLGHVFFSSSIGNLVTNTGISHCLAGSPSNTPSYAAKYALCGVPGKPACVGSSDPGYYYNWGWHTEKEMQAWGFNTVGQDGGAEVSVTQTCTYGPYSSSTGFCNWPGGVNPVKLPVIAEVKPQEYAMIGADASAYPQGEAVKDLFNGLNGNWEGYRGDGLTDVFDPKLSTYWAEYLASSNASSLTSNNPWITGVLTDDSDFFWGAGAGPDFYTTNAPNTNIAWSTMMTSPVQTLEAANSQFQYYGPYLFSHTILDAKADAKNASSCSASAPCSLRDYLKLKYGTIAALNSAWSWTGCSTSGAGGTNACPNYTTFDSSCTMVGAVGDFSSCQSTSAAETFGTGNGSAQGFSYSLAHTPLSPNSVVLDVGGTAEIGDDPWFAYAGGANPANAAAYPNVSNVTNYGALMSPAYLGVSVTGNGTTATATLASWMTWPPSLVAGSQVTLGNLGADGECGSYPGTYTVTSVNSSLKQFSFSSSLSSSANYCMATPVILTPQITGATASESGTTATIAMSSFPPGLAAGWVVLVSNCGSYDGGWAVTSVNSGAKQFSFTAASSGLGNASNCSVDVNAINYHTGAANVSFAVAPASGQAIAANYVYNGWMSGGTGLMDESGGDELMGSNGYCLEPALQNYPNPPGPSQYFTCAGGAGRQAAVNDCNGTTPCQFGSDLDKWVAQFSAEFFKTMKQGLTSAGVNIPYLGLDVVGDYDVPPNYYFLQGLAPWADAYFSNSIMASIPDANAMPYEYRFVTSAADIPFISYELLVSGADSSYYCAGAGLGDFGTQANRGQQWYNTVHYIMTTASVNNDYPLVGTAWWDWQDFQGFNQGIVTIDENPYDGVADRQAGGVDAFGIQTGGETWNYGNLIAPMEQANGIWLSELGNVQVKSVGGAALVSGGTR